MKNLIISNNFMFKCQYMSMCSILLIFGHIEVPLYSFFTNRVEAHEVMCACRFESLNYKTEREPFLV